MYKEQGVCQKHYFRFMRNGHYRLLDKKIKEKIITPNGYVTVYKPGHPLSRNKRRIFEHRYVYYDVYGDDVHSCSKCGKKIDWNTLHIDHIDRDKQNNDISNLRALCRWCNVSRDQKAKHLHKGRMAITYDGITQTPTEWARDERVCVHGSTIAKRIRRGLSVERALFSKLEKHPVLSKNKRLKMQHKYQRSNSVALTIFGITKTAAEWSRHPQCLVSDGGIRYRLKNGWSHIAAVFGNRKREVEQTKLLIANR